MAYFSPEGHKESDVTVIEQQQQSLHTYSVAYVIKQNSIFLEIETISGTLAYVVAWCLCK